VRRYQEAIKRAGDAGLGGAEAYLGLAEVYLQQGRADLALENYLQAVELKPEHDWVHYRLARFYEAQGDIDLAWEEYEKAVEYSDNEVWANTVLGDFLRGQKLYDLAIESYETARMHDLDDAIVYIRLGEVYLDRYESPDRREGDAEKAEEAFTEALVNVPDYFPIQFYIYAPRGRLYYAQQRLDEAAADFESALEWNPTSPEIQLSLARSYDDVGDWQSACGAYRKLLEPEMKAAEDWVAYAHERMAIVCAGGG
jgi:Tfp pilus assembly protein PilF